jgi:hypothetical protein
MANRAKACAADQPLESARRRPDRRGEPDAGRSISVAEVWSRLPAPRRSARTGRVADGAISLFEPLLFDIEHATNAENPNSAPFKRLRSHPFQTRRRPVDSATSFLTSPRRQAGQPHPSRSHTPTSAPRGYRGAPCSPEPPPRSHSSCSSWASAWGCRPSPPTRATRRASEDRPSLG